MHSSKALLVACLLSAVLLTAAGSMAGDAPPAGQAQPYEKVRYPTFNTNGRLSSMLEADQAEAYDLMEGTPRINFRNVVITRYDDSEETMKRTPPDQPLPVQMVITSDRGSMTRRQSDSNSPPEEVANLEGNVIIRQMRLNSRGQAGKNPSGRKLNLDPSVETEIRCQHAQWNNTYRKLNGDGQVEFIQENSRILGTGFLYIADDEAVGSGSAPSDIKDWGGIMFIEHNAVMIIERDHNGTPDITEITCEDTASYKLVEREIQFERNVKVKRRDLRMESDILKVYLRREEDMSPDADRSDPSAPVPGMVKNIVATIGKRSEMVMITGIEHDPSGKEVEKFIAMGGRADLDYDANRITLTDSRTDKKPQVTFEQGKFSDRSLDFFFNRVAAGTGAAGGEETVLETLNATGGEGEVQLGPKEEAAGREPKTDINYKNDMVYSRTDNRIRFRGSVFLKRGDLSIRSEVLDVRLAPELLASQAARSTPIERIIAETDVNIRAGEREARAQRAEYDINYNQAAGQYLDTLRLFGPPQRTPPHPWIRDENGNQISAPVLVMQRLQTGPREKPRHLLTGSEGVVACDFYTSPAKIGEKGKIISIKCEDGMEYNEATQTAAFKEKVQAESSAPEDNYVLTSDRLDIRFVERPNPDVPDATIAVLRRVNANGNARFEQDNRVCEASQIIRDFPTERLDEGDIYLEGFPAAAGRPPRPAVYSERLGGGQYGAVFAAPRIMATANGDMVRANGPGQLSVPDELPGMRAEIRFDGAALYESFRGGQASDAKFRQNVLLRQPSRNLVVTGEELDARFVKDPAAAPAAEARRRADEDIVNVQRVGRLSRAECRVNVKVDQTVTTPRPIRRLATGDKCVVEFTPNGNAVTMSVDRQRDNRRWVTVQQDGFLLRSPQVDVRDQQGVTRASGPGELIIPGDRQLGGSGRTATRILYGERGQMVYNELALNIRVNDNVRVVQPGLNDNWLSPSLDGRCDEMEIVLLEAPSQNMDQNEALARVDKMIANGSVVQRVYADPPPENPNVDWLNRPGTTFFARGDQAVYEVGQGIITMTANRSRQPQLLLNVVDPPHPPRRQRMKADKFVLNTNTIPRRYNFEGQLDSATLREGDVFDFTD